MADSNALKEYFASHPSREEAGSTSTDRFDYQKNWALVRLLNLHRRGGDYVLLCELHEDISILDSASEPKSVEFFQIKTDQDKNWTVKRLTTTKKGKSGEVLPSILSKLCASAKHLAGTNAKYFFVSNAGYSHKDAAGSKVVRKEANDYLASATLSPGEWAGLVSALEAEAGHSLEEEIRSTLFFTVAELPLKKHNEIACGLVAEFLDEYAPGTGVAARPFYRTLFDELRRRTVAKRPLGSLAAVCKAKGLDRGSFDAILKAAISVVPWRDAWLLVNQELMNEGVSLNERADLRHAEKSCYVRSLRPADSAFRHDRRTLVAEFEKALAEGTSGGILASAKVAYERAKLAPHFGAAGLSSSEALALVMVSTYERNNDEVPPADTQSPDPNP